MTYYNRAKPMRVSIHTTGGGASYLYLRPTYPTRYKSRAPSLNRRIVIYWVSFGSDLVVFLTGRYSVLGGVRLVRRATQ
jgi:hypothetical protein